MTDGTDGTDGVEEPLAPSSEEKDWPAPGEKLKKLREESGMSELEVAEALHLTVHYVKSLEKDEYQKLPGRVFIKGYFKSYALLMNSDVDEIGQCFENYCSAREDFKEQKAAAIRKKKVNDQTKLWLVLATALALTAVLISWLLNRKDDINEASAVNVFDGLAFQAPVVDELQLNAVVTSELVSILDENRFQTAGQESESVEALPLSTLSSSSQEANESLESLPVVNDEGSDERSITATENVVASSGEPIAEEDGGELIEVTSLDAEEGPSIKEPRVISIRNSGSDRLSFVVSGASWIEVSDANSDRVFNDTLEKGDELHVQSQAPFNLLIGDANQVSLQFNEQLVNLEPLIRSDSTARITLEP